MLVTVNQAVRALRKHVRKTQQIFATELGMSISALNNYERLRTPEPKQLIALQFAAHEAGRDDLAYVFSKAAGESLGLAWSAYSGSALRLENIDPDNPNHWYEVEVLKALVECLRGGTNYEDITPVVISALRLVFKRRAVIDLDTDRVDRFEQESVRRNYVPSVHGKPMWETAIRRKRSFKGLTGSWFEDKE